MAYADQQMSGNRTTAFIIVALIHVVIGYLLITGLAYEGFQQIVKKVTTIDVKKDEPKKDEPPPPPPKKLAPPPIVAPPPMIRDLAPPAPVQTVQVPPPAPPPLIPPPPAAPPPPRFTAKGAVPKGSPGNWATTNDYPAQALREERQGTTRFRVQVGPDGRVTDCEVTGSSGSPDLDATACAKIKTRARFTPAIDGDGNPTSGSYSNAIRWVIPKE
ncbi:MAG: energy transducer TonB [Novosphingobium sp.]